MSESAKEVGQRIAAERARQRYTVKGAAEQAGIARDTWKRIEAGLGVHDTSRAAALDLLGLGADGRPKPAPAGSVGLADEDLMELVYQLGQRAEREAKVTGEVPTLKELLLRQIQEEQSLAARDKGRPSRGAQLRDDTEGDD